VASDGPFDFALDYFNALADQSLLHLCNNSTAGQDEQDTYEDYESVHILKSKCQHFASKIDPGAQHKLFCDDLRFGNILVDKIVQDCYCD